MISPELPLRFLDIYRPFLVTKQIQLSGAYTGGAEILLPPWTSHPGIYVQRLKSGVVGKTKLALILKWVFSLLKSS